MDFRSDTIDLRGAELHLNTYGPEDDKDSWSWQLAIATNGAYFTVSGIPVEALEDLRIAVMAAQATIDVSTEAVA